MLHAFVDESGGRAVTQKSTDYFVMAAVVIDDTDLPAAAATLAQIRADLGRHPGDTMSWKNIKSHGQRLRAVQIMAAGPLTISGVVVCKRQLSGHLPTEDHSYLYTLRFLLERLSWVARGQHTTIDYTLAHITRFKLATLRAYEARLRAETGCQIAWAHVPAPGSIDQPNRVERLQLGDLAASAIGKAFEPDEFGTLSRGTLPN